MRTNLRAVRHRPPDLRLHPRKRWLPWSPAPAAWACWVAVVFQSARRTESVLNWDGRQHRRQTSTGRRGDAGESADRGNVGRHRQADPADPPSSSPRRLADRAFRHCPRTAPQRRRWGGCTRWPGRRRCAWSSNQLDRQRPWLHRPPTSLSRPTRRGAAGGAGRGPRRTPVGMSATAWTSSSHRATRPVAIPVRSPPWCAGARGGRRLSATPPGPRGRWHRVRASGRRRALASAPPGVDGFGLPDRCRIRPRCPARRRPVGDPAGAAGRDLQRHGATPDLLRQAGPVASRAGGLMPGTRRAPEPPPMPFAERPCGRGASADEPVARPGAVAMPVGQIVGRMNEVRPVADIIAGWCRLRDGDAQTGTTFATADVRR